MDYFFWIGIFILFILFVIAGYLYNLKTNIVSSRLNEGFENNKSINNNSNKVLAYYQRRKYEVPYVLNQNDFWLEDRNEWLNYIEPYWIYMTTPNIMARGFVNLDQMKIRYRESGIQPIEDSEKKYIANEITNLMRYWQHRNRMRGLYLYLDYWLSHIMIAKASSWLESGMPHTHDKIIVLDPSWFSSFRLGTFIHELSHVHQRKYPDNWYKLLAQWGFMHYDFNLEGTSGLEDILIRNRTNPDGLDIHWVWQSPSSNKYYWIGAVFQSISPTSLITGIEYNAYPLTQDSSGRFIYLSSSTPIPLKSFTDFQNYFRIDQNNYHPNEIISQYMEYYLEDVKNKNEERQKSIPAYGIFYPYLENVIFGQYS
jgi:hypothetical protein